MDNIYSFTLWLFVITCSSAMAQNCNGIRDLDPRQVECVVADGVCKKLNLVYEEKFALTEKIAKEAIGEYELVGIHTPTNAPIYDRRSQEGYSYIIIKDREKIWRGLTGHVDLGKMFSILKTMGCEKGKPEDCPYWSINVNENLKVNDWTWIGINVKLECGDTTTTITNTTTKPKDTTTTTTTQKPKVETDGGKEDTTEAQTTTESDETTEPSTSEVVPDKPNTGKHVKPVTLMVEDETNQAQKVKGGWNGIFLLFLLATNLAVNEIDN